MPQTLLRLDGIAFCNRIDNPGVVLQDGVRFTRRRKM
ncbi:MAG: hypothetical protein V7606_4073, partial [Burkholderiales bacterium]